MDYEKGGLKTTFFYAKMNNVKKIIFLFAFFLLVISSGLSNAYAHGNGFPPFFLINGKDTILNPLQEVGVTATGFLLPQDFAPENYLVNQTINFEVDEKALETAIIPELLKKTKYTWDFGDGTIAEGLKNTHKYTQIGSYILVLTLNIYEIEGAPPTQFMDSFLINVIPDKNYKDLPQAFIKVNGKQTDQPFKAPLEADFKKPVSFDSSSSKTPSKVVSYNWDFGDGQTSTEQNPTHTYKDQAVAIVILRVKDENGFISDAFVGVKNSSQSSKGVIQISSQDLNKKYSTYIIIAVASLFGVVVLAFIIKFFRR